MSVQRTPHQPDSDMHTSLLQYRNVRKEADDVLNMEEMHCMDVQHPTAAESNMRDGGATASGRLTLIPIALENLVNGDSK